MAKVYNARKNDLRWEDDIYCVVEDAWFEVLDVLNAKKLDGHNMDDQWLMKVEMRLRDLMNTLAEDPMDMEQAIQYKEIL